MNAVIVELLIFTLIVWTLFRVREYNVEKRKKQERCLHEFFENHYGGHVKEVCKKCGYQFFIEKKYDPRLDKSCYLYDKEYAKAYEKAWEAERLKE